MRTQILPTGRILTCSKGFTLIEILVVLVIMALALSISIPNFSKMFASVEGVREGSRVMNLLEKARAEAIFQAKLQDITFYIDGTCKFNYKGKLWEYTNLQMTILLNEEKQDHVVQTFNPDGTALHPLLSFQTTQGEYITYSFNPINGKIQMERSSNI